MKQQLFFFIFLSALSQPAFSAEQMVEITGINTKRSMPNEFGFRALDDNNMLLVQYRCRVPLDQIKVWRDHAKPDENLFLVPIESCPGMCEHIFFEGEQGLVAVEGQEEYPVREDAHWLVVMPNGYVRSLLYGSESRAVALSQGVETRDLSPDEHQQLLDKWALKPTSPLPAGGYELALTSEELGTKKGRLLVRTINGNKQFLWIENGVTPEYCAFVVPERGEQDGIVQFRAEDGMLPYQPLVANFARFEPFDDTYVQRERAALDAAGGRKAARKHHKPLLWSAGILGTIGLGSGLAALNRYRVLKTSQRMLDLAVQSGKATPDLLAVLRKKRNRARRWVYGTGATSLTSLLLAALAGVRGWRGGGRQAVE